TDEGHKGFDEVGAGIAEAVRTLLADESRAVELLGAIVNDDVLARLESSTRLGRPVLESRALRHPSFPDAVVRTPALVALDVEDVEVFGRECFGPVALLVRTANTTQSLELFRRTTAVHGAMTASVYSTSSDVLDAAREAALDVGVALSENLTGGVYVNQSVAFTDFHGTGANPAANASFIDGAFIAPRFHLVQSRRP